MQRICVVGSGGSGKTTFARQLGELLAIEVVHLDAVHWQPGWVEPPPAQWDRIVQEMVKRPAWILDGNYGRQQSVIMTAADTIILLDLPRLTCVWRAVFRAVRYFGRTRPDMAPGCPEKLDPTFLLWIWDYPERSRPSVLRRMREFGNGKDLHILRTPRAIEQFLRRAARQLSKENLSSSAMAM